MKSPDAVAVHALALVLLGTAAEVKNVRDQAASVELYAKERRHGIGG